METESIKSAKENADPSQGTFGLSLAASRWFFINTLIQRVIAFGTFFILARLLFPEDFGIISLILIVPNFLDMITSLSFENALIRHKDDTAQYLDVAWTLNILRGGSIALIVFLVAPFIASFFDISQAVRAIQLSGLFIFVQSLANIAQLYFFKEMDFKKILLRDISSKTVYFIVTIGLAFMLHSYWALFWGMMLQYATSVISTYVLHPYRPRLKFNFRVLGELLDYSVWVYGQNLMAQIIGSLEDTLVGKFVGPTGLGLYGKAKSLAGGPVTPISSMISKIGFPAFARIQDDKAKISDGISKSFDIMLVVVAPFLAAVLLGGHKIVLIILGTRWIEIVPVFKILTIGITLNVLTSIATPLFNALGMPKTSFKLDTLFTASFIVSLILLVPPFGIIGAAWSLIVSSAVMLIATIGLAYKLAYVNLKHILFSAGVVTISSLITALIGFQFLGTSFFNNNFGFIVVVGGLGIIYCGLVLFAGKYLTKGPSETIIISLKEFIHR